MSSIGGAISGLFGSKNEAEAPKIAMDPNQYKYGGNAGGADEAANRYRGWADSAQSRLGPQAAINQADYGGAKQWEDQSIYARGAQGNVANLMYNRATGATPSIAGQQAAVDQARIAQQAHQQGQQAVAAQSSQAASARGAAGLALAQQNAANNIANAQGQIGTSAAQASQNVSNQAQVNAAQERMQAEQGAMGAYSGMRGQDTQSQALAANQAQFQANALNQGAQYNAGLAQQQRGLNDQMSMGMSQLEGGVRNQQLAASQNQQAQSSADQMGSANLNAQIGGQNAAMNQKNGEGFVGAVSSLAGLALAKGGPAACGRPYLVGEKGPELFVPRAAGGPVQAGGAPGINPMMVPPSYGYREPAAVMPAGARTWGTGPGTSPEEGAQWAQQNAAFARSVASPAMGPQAVASAIDVQRQRDEETLMREGAYRAEGVKPTERELREAKSARYRLGQERKVEGAKQADAGEAGEKKPSKLSSTLSDVGKKYSSAAAGTDVSFHGGSGYTPPMLIQARAGGGRVSASEPYLVGEKGPELMVPPTDGTVIPAGPTASLMNGGNLGDSLGGTGSSESGWSKGGWGGGMGGGMGGLSKAMGSGGGGLAGAIPKEDGGPVKAGGEKAPSPRQMIAFRRDNTAEFGDAMRRQKLGEQMASLPVAGPATALASAAGQSMQAGASEAQRAAHDRWRSKVELDADAAREERPAVSFVAVRPAERSAEEEEAGVAPPPEHALPAPAAPVMAYKSPEPQYKWNGSELVLDPGEYAPHPHPLPPPPLPPVENVPVHAPTMRVEDLPDAERKPGDRSIAQMVAAMNRPRATGGGRTAPTRKRQ